MKNTKIIAYGTVAVAFLSGCTSYIGTYKSEAYETSCRDINNITLAKNMHITSKSNTTIPYDTDAVDLKNYLLPPIIDNKTLPSYRVAMHTNKQLAFETALSAINKLEYHVISSNADLMYIHFQVEKNNTLATYRLNIEGLDTKNSIAYLLNTKNKILLNSTLPALTKMLLA